jgi:REP element-mobilizing transposase RayT
MSDSYKPHNPEGIYFLTLTVVDWIDAFTRKEHKLKVVDSLRYCQGHKGLIVYAWCLMPSHLHLIAAAETGFSLSEILRDFKKFTSKQIVKAVREEPESRREWMLNRFQYAGKYQQRIEQYKFWQDGSHAQEIFSASVMQQKLRYVHYNPVEAMIVQEPEHYLFSSASNYAGLGGLLEVTVV